MDDALVGFLGTFSLPVSRLAREKRCPPDIIAACFDVLGDALRWGNLANGSLISREFGLAKDQDRNEDFVIALLWLIGPLSSPWLEEVFGSALVILEAIE